MNSNVFRELLGHSNSLAQQNERLIGQWPRLKATLVVISQDNLRLPNKIAVVSLPEYLILHGYMKTPSNLYIVISIEFRKSNALKKFVWVHCDTTQHHWIDKKCEIKPLPIQKK